MSRRTDEIAILPGSSLVAFAGWDPAEFAYYALLADTDDPTGAAPAPAPAPDGACLPLWVFDTTECDAAAHA